MTWELRRPVFSSVQQKDLVPFTQLAQDLSSENLPNYSFITPNGCDDAHDCGLNTADYWLKTNIDPLIIRTPSSKMTACLSLCSTNLATIALTAEAMWFAL
jgi:hypothetical protein